MKHLKRFNESISRDDIKSEFTSNFKATGSLEQHGEAIRSEILDFIDNLSDDEVLILDQLSKLQKGEITENDIDVENIMVFSQKFNNQMMAIVKKYQKR